MPRTLVAALVGVAVVAVAVWFFAFRHHDEPAPAAKPQAKAEPQKDPWMDSKPAASGEPAAP